MRFAETELQGAYVLELEQHVDDRGFFARAWCDDEFSQLGLTDSLAQCSLSRNTRVGTLRGMHLQRAPYEEAKVVRCTRGSIYDVIIDLRRGSETHGRWVGVELDALSGRALYVPEGFAHGFQTLEDDTDVLYMISVAYAPEAGTGVRWDDPAFGIVWPEAAERTMSDRDRNWGDFERARFEAEYDLTLR